MNVEPAQGQRPRDNKNSERRLASMSRRETPEERRSSKRAQLNPERRRRRAVRKRA